MVNFIINAATRMTSFAAAVARGAAGFGMSEYMFLGLRLTQGISINGFYNTFGVDIYQVYEDVIDKWKQTGMLNIKNGRIFCSEKGLNICNMIMADFLL